MRRALGRGNPPLFKGQAQVEFTVCVTNVSRMCHANFKHF